MTMSLQAVRSWRRALLVILCVLAVKLTIEMLSDGPEVALEMGGTYEDLYERSSASFSPLIPGHIWMGLPETDASLRFIDPKFGFVTPPARFFTVGFDDNVIISIRMSPQIEPLLLDDALKVALGLQDQWRKGGWQVAGPSSYPPFADTPAWRALFRDENTDAKTYWKAGGKYQVTMYMSRFEYSKYPNEERYLITLSIGKPWTPFDEVEEGYDDHGQCQRIHDGRTIGFSNSPLADLSDIKQRMRFVFRAAGRFDQMLNDTSLSVLEQSITEIASGQEIR